MVSIELHIFNFFLKYSFENARSAYFMSWLKKSSYCLLGVLFYYTLKWNIPVSQFMLTRELYQFLIARVQGGVSNEFVDNGIDELYFEKISIWNAMVSCKGEGTEKKRNHQVCFFCFYFCLTQGNVFYQQTISGTILRQRYESKMSLPKMSLTT